MSGSPVEIIDLVPGSERQELHFDRCQFDPMFQPNHFLKSPEEMAAFEEGLRINGGTPITDDSEIDFEYIKREVGIAGGLPYSEAVQRAINCGESWALAAITANIFKLPRKQALALIWRYWGGFTFEEISQTLGWSSRQAAAWAVDEAKKSLVKSMSSI